jgi:membrane-associated phospholipid phosphatase
MRFVTNLGNSVVVLPVAAAMLVWLAVLVGRRSAVTWCWALLVAGGGTALLKILLSACGAPSGALESPSGHTSMSTLVYGGLALILGAETEAWERLAAAALGTAMVAAIALSRIALGAHSALEVVVGFLIGSAALALFGRAYLHDRRAGRQLWTLVAAVVVLAAALHSHPAQLEPVWHKIAIYLRDTTGLCSA